MQSVIRRPRPAGTAGSFAGLSPDAQAALNLGLVRVAAWILPPATAIVLVTALTDGDTPLLVVAAASALTGATAIWQLAIGRPQALVLNLMAAAIIGGLAPLLSHNVSASLATGLVVLLMTGIAQVPPRWLNPYVWFMGSMWATHLMIRHFVGGDWPGGISLAYLAQVVFLVFGASAMVSMRRQIARSESRFSYLFANAPVAMWENDFSGVRPWMEELRERGIEDLRAYLAANPSAVREGIARVRTTDANPAAAALIGASHAADLRGPFPSEIIDAESERLFSEQFVTIWEKTGGGELEYTGHRLDGTAFDGVLHFSPPSREYGLSRMVTTVTDVTRLRQVEEDLARSEITSGALLEALPDLIFLCEADGTYLDYHAASKAEGTQHSTSTRDLYVAPEEFLGRKPHDILPEALATQMMITIVTALETDHVQTFEYDLPINDEDRHWEMRIAPLRGRSQVLALVRDITTQTKARLELERLVLSKDDFIAAISHEIRTPLTGIIGFTRLLNDRGRDLDPDERRSMMETLAVQSTDLANMVEDMLVAAKADLGRLTFASVPTNLRAQVAQVLEGWEPDVVNGIAVVGESVTSRADPARVRQIIRNLISNALRYGGQSIEIRIDSEDSITRVIVADDGPGIPEDEAEKVFRPYERAAPDDGLTAALGIGLPISRTLARLMGGDLTYRHRDGETLFILSLPVLDPDLPLERVGFTAPPTSLLGRER